MSPTDGMWVYILFIAGGINVLIGYALSWPSIVAVYERTFGKKDPKTKKPTNFLRVLYVCWVILALMAAVSYLTIFVYGVVLNHGKSLEYMYLIPGMVTFMTGAIFWSYTVSPWRARLNGRVRGPTSSAEKYAVRAGGREPSEHCRAVVHHTDVNRVDHGASVGMLVGDPRPYAHRSGVILGGAPLRNGQYGIRHSE
jgi:hypothetical protein